CWILLHYISQEEKTDKKSEQQTVSSSADDKTQKKPEEPQEKPVRKRKWGSARSSSSTTTTPQAKNKRLSSIEFSTESLKELIPDIKSSPISEPVLDLDLPDERISDQENEPEENPQEVKIQRTIVVREDEEKGDDGDDRSEGEVVDEDDKDKESDSEEEEEQGEGTGDQEEPARKVEKKEESSPEKKTEPKIIRQISRPQPLIEPDEPTAARRSPSPPRKPVSNVVHIRNLVRPFTLNQLKELLKRTGNLVEDSFWIDNIKSHCIVTYEKEEEATATRKALHGTQWPSSNPKVLRVEYASQEELERFQNADKPIVITKEVKQDTRKEREEKERAEREARREARKKEEEEEKKRRRTPPMREWDRHKIRQSQEREEGPPRRGRSRSRSPKRGRGRSGEQDSRRDRRDQKVEDEPPAKLLDDLFKKTKTTPCIYWIPLSEEQASLREKKRQEEKEEQEKMWKEREENAAKRLQERRERSPWRGDDDRRRGGIRIRSRSRDRPPRNRSGSRSRDRSARKRSRSDDRSRERGRRR
ncbi:apoptotic chromatin condensation inducer in the nucleus-like, partial [Saccostrea cucullata]|uniref:apoptotic chromatin condensation inducer in the nucleus-like n=1 Tax=Saccostrea cuccullata TaxID=36930 RepID=UPI002ED5C300